VDSVHTRRSVVARTRHALIRIRLTRRPHVSCTPYVHTSQRPAQRRWARVGTPPAVQLQTGPAKRGSHLPFEEQIVALQKISKDSSNAMPLGEVGGANPPTIRTVDGCGSIVVCALSSSLAPNSRMATATVFP